MQPSILSIMVQSTAYDMAVYIESGMSLRCKVAKNVSAFKAKSQHHNIFSKYLCNEYKINCFHGFVLSV